MKKNLMNASMISVATAIVLSMTGCGGGGSDSGTTTSSATSTTTSGTGSDGYINQATVCLDMNMNGKCDTNSSYSEPITATDENGSYTLTISAAQQAEAQPNAPILLVGGMDVDSKKNLVGALKAPYAAGTASANITPLSTMVTALVENNVSITEAYTKVAQAVGLSPDEVKADPVKLAKEGKREVLAAAMTLHRIVSTMATAANDANDTAAIYSGLTAAIENASADTNNSVATLITAAADDANSTLPQKAREAAKVAQLIEDQVKTAVVDSNQSLANAAVIADAAVDVIKKEVVTAVENNTSIDDNFITSVENNATTAASVDPVEAAIKNLLISYLGEPQAGTEDQVDAAITEIKNTLGVTDSSEVTARKIALIDLSSGVSGSLSSLVYQFRNTYNMQEIKSYVEKLGYTISDDTLALLEFAWYHVATGPDAVFSSAMTKEAFATKIYETGEDFDNAELMTLALKINPPANIASMSDIEKAKALFDSVRTQVNHADTFTQTESTKIDTALNSVAGNVEFTTTAFNTINDMVTQAVDTNTTTVSRLVDNGDRNITVSKGDAASGNVLWDYTIKDTNVTNPWSGSVTYTDVDPDTFDPSNFTILNAKLTGTMPLDYYGAVIPAGKENSQSIDANINIDKISNGAQVQLDADLANNGDSVKITDAKLVVIYDVNSTTQEPLPKYVELQNLYVNGTVGDYTLDGKLDVKSYAVNKIKEAKGFNPETTYSWIGGTITCGGDLSSTNLSEIKWTYNGVEYNNDWVGNGADAFYDGDANETYLSVGFNNVKGDNIVDAFQNISNYSGLSGECVNATIGVANSGSWTDDDFENSGHLPSEITFDGTLTNNITSSYLNANIDAKWNNIVDANMSSDTYKPNLSITAAGTLSMPESEVMKVNLQFDNIGDGKDVKVTYVNADTSITADSAIPGDDSNITVNLSSTTGIQAKIITDSQGNVNYGASTLTNSNGETVGSFEDRAGAPVVKYSDGTFETLF